MSDTTRLLEAAGAQLASAVSGPKPTPTTLEFGTIIEIINYTELHVLIHGKVFVVPATRACAGAVVGDRAVIIVSGALMTCVGTMPPD